MYYEITKLNADSGAVFHSDVESVNVDEPGELFRMMQKKYGRCASAVRVDTETNEGRKVGWVFESVEQFTDSPDTYRREVWVTLLTETASHESGEFDYFFLD